MTEREDGFFTFWCSGIAKPHHRIHILVWSLVQIPHDVISHLLVAFVTADGCHKQC